MTDFRVSFPRGRRQFLLASVATSAAAYLCGGLEGLMPLKAAEAQGVRLTPSQKSLYRVRIEMELQGNVNVPENPLVSLKRSLKLPVKSSAKLDYEERLHLPPGSDSGEVTIVERFYHEAISHAELNRNQSASGLRESARRVVVNRESLPEVVFSEDDYLHRDELELMRLPVSSVAVDQLLPSGLVEIGSEYEPSREAIVSLLNLTSVEAGGFNAQVVSITDQEAKIHLRGKVDGSVDGVPTEIRTIGKLTFDRHLGVCTWLAIAIHETREIGVAEPGFDLAATIKMLRKPLDEPVVLTSINPPRDAAGVIPQDRLYVELVGEQLGFSTLMDRRWRIMRDVPGATMMRMIETDRSIAQCDFRPLATLKPGVQWTLEAFQQDVRQTLGEQLRDLIEAEEFVSPTGLRVLRVVAQGSVEGVPIQWVMLHFSDDSGRRLLGTCTMEGDHVAFFAGADAQLAGTLRYLPRNNGSGETPLPEGSPRSTDREVARVNQGGNADDELQSASDLR